MTAEEEKPPIQPEPARPKPSPREERLKAALRDNLRRRKAAGREREPGA